MSAKFKIKFLSVTVVCLILIGVYYVRVTNAIFEVGEIKAEASLTSSVYRSITDMFNEDSFKYEDFFSVIKDAEGNVSLFITDAVSVNAFTFTVANKVCAYMLKYAEGGVNVPAGIFTGIKILSGYGNNVNIHMIEISSVNCYFNSEFESAGINQVKHSLYVKVVPEITIKAIGRTKKSSAEISVLVFENMIVGKVPEIYIDSSLRQKNI